MTVIEFICFSDFVQPHEAPSGVEGLAGFYSGQQIEDPTEGFIVFLWRTLKAHHTAKETDVYKKLVSLAGSHVLRSYVIPDPSPEENILKVFDAPTTEFAVARLRSEEKRTRWLEVAEMTFGGIPSIEGALAGIRANKTETDNRAFFFLIGWVSIEHHKAALALPFADEIFGETQALTEFIARHSKLTKHL